MRDIKFRVWDSKSKTMHNVIAFWQAANEPIGHVVIEVGSNPLEVDTLFNNFELMQLTGLKDTDGRHIYENDVCDVHINVHGKPSGTSFKAGIKYNEHIGAFQIKYRSMAGGFCTDNIDRYFLKVIGNIHQNPDLLS